MPPTIIKRKFKEVDIRQDGDRVIVIKEGITVFDMPWDGALALSKALYTQAKLAEEVASALGIIYDEAILIRAGVPISLSGHPGIRKEAEIEAVNNPKLRRYLPGGVKSEEHVGAPTVYHGKPSDRKRRKTS